MVRSLGPLIALLPLSLLPPGLEPALGQPATPAHNSHSSLPLSRDQPIETADARLRRAGWQPAGDPGLQAFERQLARNGLSSLSGCSGTGAGYCRYDYRRGNRRLAVVTATGDDGRGRVLRWFETP